jgi:hypothetical protein
MSKVFKSIVGLVVVGAAIGLAAAPAKAESKAAQCKRFRQSVRTFSQQLPDMKPNENYNDHMSQWLDASEAGLKQLQSQKFTDPKIRSFHQTTVYVLVRSHNYMRGTVKSVEHRGRSSYLVEPKQNVKVLSSLGESIEAYCGRSK